MIGTLIRLESSNNNLRTNSVDGEFDVLPEVGKYFTIKGKSLTPGGAFRLVETSFIKDVMNVSTSEYYFNTQNSKYKLEIKQ